ncbi:MAG: methyltransferase domain-containing protein [Chloroflexi bacterium]|nr:methyltransferase domain-containing protein [Chloroflexota bacterium]
MSALRPDKVEALAEWAARVKANRDQAERLREPAPPGDFYAPIASVFRADPRREGEPELAALRALVEPGETWLDIGAGGGRYALPLALRAKEVIALDPSEGMLSVLRTAMAEEGIDNVRVVQSRWPAPELSLTADAAFIAHVGYDIEDIGPFLDAMEVAAGRLCAALLLAESPAAPASAFWPAIHGEERAPLPALREFLALQLARGRLCEVRLFERPPAAYHAHDNAVTWLRQQLFVAPGSEKDQQLQKLAAERLIERDGQYGFARRGVPLGLVTWAPR